jgi:hypothetical protein
MTEEQRRIGLQLRIVEGKLLAVERWAEVSQAIHDAEDREAVLAGVEEMLGIDRQVAFHVLDLPLLSRTDSARQKLEAERALLVAKL